MRNFIGCIEQLKKSEGQRVQKPSNGIGDVNTGCSVKVSSVCVPIVVLSHPHSPELSTQMTSSPLYWAINLILNLSAMPMPHNAN